MRTPIIPEGRARCRWPSVPTPLPPAWFWGCSSPSSPPSCRLSSVFLSLCVARLGVDVSEFTHLGSFQPFFLLQPSTPVLPPEPQGHKAGAPEALLVSGLSWCSQDRRPVSCVLSGPSTPLWVGSVSRWAWWSVSIWFYFLFLSGHVSSLFAPSVPAAH